MIDLLSYFIKYVLLEDAKSAVKSIVFLDIDRLYGSQDSEEVRLEGWSLLFVVEQANVLVEECLCLVVPELQEAQIVEDHGQVDS